MIIDAGENKLVIQIIKRTQDEVDQGFYEYQAAAYYTDTLIEVSEGGSLYYVLDEIRTLLNHNKGFKF